MELRLLQSGEILEIKLVDHIILGSQRRYVSMKAVGLI